eukprot:496127-Amphidinium_carterae.1
MGIGLGMLCLVADLAEQIAGGSGLRLEKVALPLQLKSSTRLPCPSFPCCWLTFPVEPDPQVALPLQLKSSTLLPCQCLQCCWLTFPVEPDPQLALQDFTASLLLELKLNSCRLRLPLVELIGRRSRYVPLVSGHSFQWQPSGRRWLERVTYYYYYYY